MTNEKVRQVLSTLWIFFMLNLVFRDIHEIGTAAFLNEALAGKINGAVIPARSDNDTGRIEAAQRHRVSRSGHSARRTRKCDCQRIAVL